MDKIRLTYSGLLAFITRLVSVITGIVFTIIVTRNLTPEDFGLWRLIGGLIYYVIVFEPVVTYWVSRHVARGEPAAKTGLGANSSFSAIAILAYIAIIASVSNLTNSDFKVLMLAAILVPLTYISNTLDGINLGFKPQGVSYGFITFELAKLPAALLLVYFLKMGIAGAILAVAIAYVLRLGILLYTARSKLHEKFEVSLIKRWLKLAWLPLYANIAGLIFTLDVLLVSTILGSVKPLALYAAATTISNTVAHSGVIAQALYPKLLTDIKKEYVEDVLKRVLLFGIPLTAAAIIYAKPALFVLNPVYVVATPAVYIWALATLAYTIAGVMYFVLTGIERVDISFNTKFADYRKSKLFLAPTVFYMQHGSYIGLLVAMLFVTTSFGLQIIDLVTLWAFIGLITQIPFTVYFWRLVVKHLPFSFPWKSIARYTLGAGVSATILFFINNYILIYDVSIYVFAPRLAVSLTIGAVIYFAIIYAIDTDFKSLTKAIFSSLTSK